MKIFYICLLVIAIILILVLSASFVCFFMAFYVVKKKQKEEFAIPKGEIYKPYRDIMVNWMKETRSMPHKEVSIKSFDGLTLYGKYYEYSKDAPIELMIHGYRGTAE